ncbi:unnamed protein product, partial [Lymnaea stagnalis]
KHVFNLLQTWFHYVHRISPNSPNNSGVLLRSVHTCCWNCSFAQETVYTQGLFHLSKGDIIQICFSGQGLVDFDPKSTFVGLFMLESSRT